MDNGNQVRNGSCTCGHVQYQVNSAPLIVHCCHCRGCQKNSGAAFSLAALIEADRVGLLSGIIEEITVPTPSGVGQIITRCTECKVAVWSTYHMGGLRKRIRFVCVGTLQARGQLSPDIHIFTASKQPWVVLPLNDPAVSQFYEWGKTWSYDSLKRLAEVEKMAGITIT